MDAVMIGAIAGSVLGAVLIGVVVTCVVFLSKRLKRRTNSRAKLIKSDGEVVKKKWPAEYKQGSGDAKHQKRIFFGDVNETEHVEVKERRRMHERPYAPYPTRKRPEVILPPAPPPPPPPPPLVLPPLQPSPRLHRINYRSLPRKHPEPAFKRRPSFGAEKPPKYFLYGIPHPSQMIANSGTYGTWIPPATAPPAQPVPEPQPAPPPPPAPAPAPPKVVELKPSDIEEQERVLVVDDMMTERTFNPRWQGTIRAADATSAAIGGYDYSYNTTNMDKVSHESSKVVPRIVTEVV